jgi:hypothetical protein
MRWLLVVLLAACGDNKFESLPYFEWTDQQTVGAFEIDHVPADDPGLIAAVDRAKNFEVVLFYGLDPPNGTQYETIEALFARAERNGGRSSRSIASTESPSQAMLTELLPWDDCTGLGRGSRA